MLLLYAIRAGTISTAMYFLVCLTSSFPILKSPQPKSHTVREFSNEVKNVVIAFRYGITTFGSCEPVPE